MVKNLLLDRDGVINKLVESNSGKISPQSLKQFEYILGSRKAIKKAKEKGLSIYVFSNQPDVSKNWRRLDKESLEEINQELREIGVDQIFNCTHGPEKWYGKKRYRDDTGKITVCDCRKPQPGLIEKCVGSSDLEPSGTVVVGDNDVDIEAAERFETKFDINFKSKIKLGKESVDQSSYENLKQFVIEEVL